MDFSKMHYAQSAVILNVENICSALLVEVPKTHLAMSSGKYQKISFLNDQEI